MQEEREEARFCAGHGEGLWGRGLNEGLKGTRRAEEAGRAEASPEEKAQAGLCRWMGPGEVRRSWGQVVQGSGLWLKRPQRACDVKALGVGWVVLRAEGRGQRRHAPG